jgi:hypothetical protein
LIRVTSWERRAVRGIRLCIKAGHYACAIFGKTDTPNTPARRNTLMRKGVFCLLPPQTGQIEFQKLNLSILSQASTSAVDLC